MSTTALSSRALSASSMIASARPSLGGSRKDAWFDDEDVTTVYDALRASDDALLVQALLFPHAPRCGGAGLFDGGLCALVRRRICAAKALALSVGPNLDSAADSLIRPWGPACLAGLAGASWPDVLGRRIVLPAGFGQRWRHRRLADILLVMSSL